MAHLEYGDVDVKLMNPETGDWMPVKSVIKLHPYTGPHGCMNRAQPVNALAITDCRNHAEDLVLGIANNRGVHATGRACPLEPRKPVGAHPRWH